jgi:hypothetical protein
LADIGTIDTELEREKEKRDPTVDVKYFWKHTEDRVGGQDGRMQKHGECQVKNCR